ncbi:hypothetical protein EMIT019CA3_210033 [Bacillus pseudomycoides]
MFNNVFICFIFYVEIYVLFMIICSFYINIMPTFPLLNTTIFDFLRYSIFRILVTVRATSYLLVLYKFYLYILNIYKICIYIRFYYRISLLLGIS